MLRPEKRRKRVNAGEKTRRVWVCVLTNIQSKVTTDGTRGTGHGVGLAQHDTTGLDGILTSPDHTNNGTATHVLDQTREERLTSQVLVLN